MSQDQTEILHGPFNVSFSATAGGDEKQYTGSNKASIEISLTTKIVTEDIVDGAEIYDEGGRQVVVRFLFDELVAADMDTIEGINSGAAPEIVVEFTNMPAAKSFLTIPADSGAVLGLKAFASIENGKSVITVMFGAPAGTTLAEIIQIAAA